MVIRLFDQSPSEELSSSSPPHKGHFPIVGSIDVCGRNLETVVQGNREAINFFWNKIFQKVLTLNGLLAFIVQYGASSAGESDNR
jgi:hypothetical protein